MCDVRILVLSGPGLDHEEGQQQTKEEGNSGISQQSWGTWILPTTLPSCHPSLRTCTRRRLGD